MDFVGLLVSVLPVAVFLLAMVVLDSFKLVGGRPAITAVVAGLGAAAVCYVVNSLLLELPRLSLGTYARYVSPVVEESVKAAYVVFLVASRRVGFPVDAAIYGFAVGTGFAILENVSALLGMPGETPLVWVVRGFGTAVMHGGTTALFGIFAQSLSSRRSLVEFGSLAAGLGLAIVLHSLYNHFLVSPVYTAAGIVIAMPLLMHVVFRQSDRVLRRWLGVGFDSDTEILAMMNSGDIGQTRLGVYLQSLKKRFPPDVVTDMFCLLSLHTELSIRAKGVLIMREAGIEIPPDPELREKFEELRHLERAVGRTGRLALSPFLRWSRRKVWQLTMLKGGGAPPAGAG